MRFACRLAEKIYLLGHRVYIHAEAAAQAGKLDDLLWTFRGGSFVPHALLPSPIAAETPIVIGHDTAPEHHSDVLINLGTDVPSFFSRFTRLAELVDGDPGRREQARTRFRYYRERGYALATHKISASDEP